MRVVGDAVRDPVAPKDQGVAGSVITRDRLVGPGLEAQDVLRTQPGVAVTESGGFGAPATAAVRGATAADTPVYLAGVRLNDDVGGSADLSLVPLWLLHRVEIYRSNAPLEGDQLGIGGAIFFEPRRPTKDMGGVGHYGGSWGASKGWAYAGMRSGGVSALVGVSADHATNRYPFLDDHGTLFEPEHGDDRPSPERRRGDARRLGPRAGRPRSRRRRSTCSPTESRASKAFAEPRALADDARARNVATIPRLRGRSRSARRG